MFLQSNFIYSNLKNVSASRIVFPGTHPSVFVDESVKMKHEWILVGSETTWTDVSIKTPMCDSKLAL